MIALCITELSEAEFVPQVGTEDGPKGQGAYNSSPPGTAFFTGWAYTTADP